MSTASSTPFDGLRVAIFEARMAGTLAELVARQGGIPVAAPALREIPLGDNPDARSFADGLLATRFDVVIFETGAGVRYLAEALDPRFPRAGWAAALSRTKVVARGPKPAAALRELGVSIDLQVPEPNTWRETLTLLDARLPVAGLRVAVQEYGQPVPELTDGLERRGAVVTRVPVYRWALPEDTAPLRAALTEIAERRIGAALFTAAQQVEHVLQVAAAAGIEGRVRAAMAGHVVVGSIGPTTSAALRAHGLPVDIEPEHPKSGHLVAAVAASWRRIAKADAGESPGGR
jgi:uroporphyrinogen-III synthase